jgi:hypothetical protein
MPNDRDVAVKTVGRALQAPVAEAQLVVGTKLNQMATRSFAGSKTRQW